MTITGTQWWGIVSFLILQLIAAIKFIVNLYTSKKVLEARVNALEVQTTKNTEDDLTRQAKIEERWTGLETKLEAMNTRIGEIAQGLVRVETKVENIEKNKS